MKDRNLPDNEIVKALESEIHLAEYVDSDYCSNVKLEIIKSALDLITRQQAEIERLKECPKCVYEYDSEIMEYCVQGPCPNFKTVKQIKFEAYKEFAEMLKTEIDIRPTHSKKQNEYVFFLIDNLLKEKVGEDE